MPAESSEKDPTIFPETEFVENHEPKGVKDRLMDIYYDAIPLFNTNLAWFLLSLPLVTFLPALGGLYHAVLEYNRKAPSTWRVFWEGVKKNWVPSLKWGGVVLLGNLILALNIWFSLTIDANWSILTLMVGLTVALIWIILNQFSLPMMLLQEEKKVFLALRNAYVITVRRPWDALKVTLLTLLIGGISVVVIPLWFFISMGLIAHIQTRALLRAIDKINAQDAERDAADSHREGVNPEGKAEKESGGRQ